ncbi:MAG: hypothetical protein ACYTFG_00955 [Planctomycetota bacterium]|jgi:hypothetical protein
MSDLKSPALIYLKAILFLLILASSVAWIGLETRNWMVVGLALLVAWSAARLYYFMFYVVEKYVDPEYRFSGILSFLLYLAAKKDKSRGRPGP